MLASVTSDFDFGFDTRGKEPYLFGGGVANVQPSQLACEKQCDSQLTCKVGLSSPHIHAFTHFHALSHIPTTHTQNTESIIFIDCFSLCSLPFVSLSGWHLHHTGHAQR